MLLTKGLEHAGFSVISVANGEAALAEFERRGSEIEVLVLDQAMPGAHSGTDVVRAIRQLSPGIPAIIVSGHHASADEDDWPAGVALLRKPFAPQQLVEQIRGLLESV